MRRSLLVAAALAATARAGDIKVILSSQAGAQWAPQPDLSWGADFPSAVDVTFNLSSLGQEMLGFGAAATDTSAYNFVEWMSPATQADYLDALWGPDGLGWSIARVTLNSADYSFKSFNYDNVTDDFTLSHFDHNVSYDRLHVIPMLSAAKAKAVSSWGDDIRLFASPWSPPKWMKNPCPGCWGMINSALPGLKADTPAGSYAAAWADYIVAWLAAYEAAGLPMWALTPQNEPEAQQAKFESCAYTPAGMGEFIARHLGPKLRAAFPQLVLMGYDHNKLDSLMWADALLGNATVAPFVDAFAVHWYDYTKGLGLANLATIKGMLQASKGSPSPRGGFILNTEACFLANLTIDWRLAHLYAADIMGDIAVGASGWLAWNHVLVSGDMYPWALGGPNHDNTTIFGDPLLFRYDADGSQAIVRQAPYWVIGHLSRYARPGSHAVGVSGAGVASSASSLQGFEDVRAYALNKTSTAPAPTTLLANAFLSPDGASSSVVVFNPSDSYASFKLRDGTSAGAVRAARVSLPPHSIATFTFAA